MSVVAQTVEGSVVTGSIYGLLGVGFARVAAREAFVHGSICCSPAWCCSSWSLPGLVPTFRYAAGDHYPYKNWFLHHVVGSTTTIVDTLPASAS